MLDVLLFPFRVLSFDHPVTWDPSPSQLLCPLVCLYYLPQVYIGAFPMWCCCPIIHYCFVVYDQLFFLVCQPTHNGRPLQLGPIRLLRTCQCGNYLQLATFDSYSRPILLFNAIIVPCGAVLPFPLV